jgi:hypothetical protein
MRKPESSSSRSTSCPQRVQEDIGRFHRGQGRELPPQCVDALELIGMIEQLIAPRR